MNRAMTLAFVLFAPYRTPAALLCGPDGTLDESQCFTPCMVAALMRYMTPEQRAFLESPTPPVRPLVHRWSGKSYHYQVIDEIREALR